MNSDTFAAYFGASYVGASSPGTSASATRNLLLDQTLAATTETEFKLGQDSGGSGTIAVLSVPQQGDIVGASAPLDYNANSSLLVNNRGMMGDFRGLRGAPYFNSASFDSAHPFTITICGIATPASNAGNTYAVKVYGGTTKSGTNIATTGATAVATTTSTFGFCMFIQCVWSSGSGNLRGWFQFECDGTTPGHGNPATLTSAFSAADVAHLQFCASMTWGNAAGGTTKITEFSMSQQ